MLLQLITALIENKRRPIARSCALNRQQLVAETRMRTITVGLFWFQIAGIASGQAPTPQLTFEVASVKQSVSNQLGMFTRFLPNGDVRITGASLKNLISIAYGIRSFQIYGGPKWVDQELFDIDARAATLDATMPNNAPKVPQESHAGERLRNLLADRFELTTHSEIKNLPVYELVVANGGTKLKESKESSTLIRMVGRGTLKGQAVYMRQLVVNLSGQLDGLVVDKTGLTEKYDFELNWAANPLSTAPLASSDPSGPSLLQALQEQLGLRIESKKGPVKVLWIDGAERPSKN